MRPLLALILVVSILGGMQTYMTFRPQPMASSTPAELLADGSFQVEITTTFAAGADPFALDLSDAPSLLVTFRGRDLIRETRDLLAGETLVAENIDGIVAGTNEFFIQASPQNQEASAARAVRVRVLQDGIRSPKNRCGPSPGIWCRVSLSSMCKSKRQTFVQRSTGKTNERQTQSAGGTQ